MISNEIVSNYDDTVARNVDVSFVPDLVHNGWAIMAGPYRLTGRAI